MGDEGIAGVLSLIGVKVNTWIFPRFGSKSGKMYVLTVCSVNVKNRDKPYYKEKALETCVLEQKYLSTDRLLGTTRELALILNMWSFPYKIIYKIIPIYTIGVLSLIGVKVNTLIFPRFGSKSGKMYVLTVCSVNVTNRVDPIEVFKLACTGRVIPVFSSKNTFRQTVCKGQGENLRWFWICEAFLTKLFTK
jgi:hypothetical protein